jgi:hypothetical protein
MGLALQGMVSRLSDGRDGMNRQARVPLQPRNRKRWLAAAGVAVIWAFFAIKAGSVLAGTLLLVLIGAAAVLLMVALRSLGINRDHPWVQWLAARPWRDGRDVLQLALRHLPEVLIITPGGRLLAPNSVEIRMNQADLDALTEMMDIELVNASATEAYQGHIRARSASLAGAGRVEVNVLADPDVAPGRYRLRQGKPAGLRAPLPPLPPLGPPPPAEHPSWMGLPASRPPSPQPSPAPSGAGAGQAKARTIVAETATVAALAPIPLLRLVTDGRVGETRTSPARAGRAREAEFPLPPVPTVSRVHAEFTFTGGEWHITSLGLNGLTLNGNRLTQQHVIRDGDMIGWGTQQGVPRSRVEIGKDTNLPAHPWSAN